MNILKQVAVWLLVFVAIIILLFSLFTKKSKVEFDFVEPPVAKEIPVIYPCLAGEKCS